MCDFTINCVCRWADVRNYHLTDQLLSIIEDSTRYWQAFGFKGGDIPGVTSGGKSSIQMCCEIAGNLFPLSTVPCKKLGDSIKNRIYAYVIHSILLLSCTDILVSSGSSGVMLHIKNS